MTHDDFEDRLSKIDTHWTEIRQAQAGSGKETTNAQEQLWQRYSGAVRRYFYAAVRDPAAVEDLMQEFALTVVQGKFRNADPKQGHFRKYLKGVLFHMIRHYHRERPKHPDQSFAVEQLPAPA